MPSVGVGLGKPASKLDRRRRVQRGGAAGERSGGVDGRGGCGTGAACARQHAPGAGLPAHRQGWRPVGRRRRGRGWCAVPTTARPSRVIPYLRYGSHLAETRVTVCAGWEWRSEWTQDVKPGQTDADGWRYAPRFNPEVAGWAPEASMIRLVRRRRWLRLRVRINGQDGGGQAVDGMPGLAARAQARSSAEDIRALAEDVVTPSGATLPQLLSYTPAQLLEVAAELEIVAPQRATVIAPVRQQQHPGILALQQGASVDVLSSDLDPRGEWWLVRQQTGPRAVVGFANRKNLQVVQAWGEAPPTSTLYTWGRNNHAQLGYAKHDQILHQARDSGWRVPEGMP